MLSKNTIKRLNQLAIKKNRVKENLFLVEGDKMILELAESEFKVAELYITKEMEPIISKGRFTNTHVQLVSSSELKKISQLKTPQNSLAVCQIRDSYQFPEFLTESLSIYLDGIQDPGNLGTILRICDWFGIQHVFISADTVDLYNPKVIQASMGSFARVQVYETDFSEIKSLATKSEAVIYGAFMSGENIYTQKLAEKALLVMGNEGNGIRPEIESQIKQKLSIPNFSSKQQKADSLNVSVATAVICSEFKRNR